jgi:peptidoglycan/xylan/chitin deacetylase (PgdA/CDA1 family)
MVRRTPNVFILYYHNICPRPGFDIAYRTFHNELKILKSYFNIVTLDDIYEFLTSPRTPSKTSVAITFDDGYTDNFVYAYPLLKKHGFKATLFQITSRIQMVDQARPTLEDYWEGRVPFRDLYQAQTIAASNRTFFETGKSDAFITSEELKKMQDVFEMGSHGDTHARIFCKDQITDIYDGSNGHWSYSYTYDETPIRGYPIFPSMNNLSARHGKLKEEVKTLIKNLEPNFFKQNSWKNILTSDLQSKFPSLLDFETEEERDKRVSSELRKSKDILEGILDKRVRYLSYPFGHVDSALKNIASQYFDAAFTTHADIVQKETDIHLIPRTIVHKDIFSFLSRIIKFSRKK